jgi:hypothetical protein
VTDIAVTTVGNFITDPTGTPITGVQIDIRIVPRGSFIPDDANPEAINLAGARYTAVSGMTGGWTVDLPRSSALTFSHYYEVKERIPAAFGGAVVTAFCVPDSDTCVSLQNCLFTPSPPGPPDA